MLYECASARGVTEEDFMDWLERVPEYVFGVCF